MYIGLAHRDRLMSYRFVCDCRLRSFGFGRHRKLLFGHSIFAVPRFQVTIQFIEDVAVDPNIKVYIYFKMLLLKTVFR